MTNLNKGLRLGGVFASQTIDKSGEIIDIKGLDISALNSGESYLNSEHHNNNFSNYLGRIVHAKKIFKYEDCESEHEKNVLKKVVKFLLSMELRNYLMMKGIPKQLVPLQL